MPEELSASEDLKIEPLAPDELHQVIEALAYQYWRERLDTGMPGDALGDWLEAESAVNCTDIGEWVTVPEPNADA